MRHKKIYLNDLSDNVVAFSNYQKGESNSRQVSDMKKILRKAIEYELTPKQRYCICEHYLNGKSMKNIASELDINPSTVTRHIQNGVSRLQRVARYY